MIWTKLHPERVSEIALGVRRRAKASGKHRCETCNINLASITAFNKYLNTKAHKEQVRLSQGGRLKAVSMGTMRSRAFYAKDKTNKTHYCSICDMIFNIKGYIDKHLKTTKHLRKAARRVQ